MTIIASGINISAIAHEKFDNLQASVACSQREGRVAIVFELHIGAVIDEEFDNINTQSERGVHDRYYFWFPH